MDINKDIEDILIKLTDYLSAKKLKIASAESITGGLLAFYLTSLAGSSKWFEYGFISYSNVAKHNIFNIPQNILNKYGAVSEPIVKLMAQAALQKSTADFAISISGIAGPSSDEFATPVGTVFVAIADKILNKSLVSSTIFTGHRTQIRYQAVKFALQSILDHTQKIGSNKHSND